jgi:hypothetical protein
MQIPQLDIDLLDTGGHGDEDPLVKQVARRVEGVEAEGGDGRPGGLAEDRARHLLVEADQLFLLVPATLWVDEVDDRDAGVDVAPPVGEQACLHGFLGLKVGEDVM